jgi:hypothetical protein
MRQTAERNARAADSVLQLNCLFDDAAGLTVCGPPVDISVVPVKKGSLRFVGNADMAELADALGSGPSGRKVVEVRVLLSAPNN